MLINSKFFVWMLVLLSIESVNGQWAGSSSHAGTTKVSQPTVQNNNSGQSNGYLGIGFGGYTKSLIAASSYLNAPGYSSFNYITSATYDDVKGTGYCFGGLWPTTSKNLQIGLEIGGGYHFQDVSYQYYDYYDQQVYSRTGELSSVHFGAGMPVRYNFVNTKEFKMYLQGTIGMGFVDVNDDQGNSLIDGPEVIFYGGGSLGMQVSVFFIEVGANSSGYLRCGLAW